MEAAGTEISGLVQRFLAIDPLMDVRTIAVFLEAAREPGISISEISKRTGISHPRVAICAAKLGTSKTGGGKSYGLARLYVDRSDFRTKRLAPTELGQSLLSS